MAAEWLFWGCFFLIAYACVLYPVCLRLWSAAIRRRPAPAIRDAPAVSFLICACNEESGLAQKIENTLAIDYPRDRLDILIVSDGSADRTNAIAQSFGASGVRLLALPERSGKTAAQNAAAPQAQGDILVFSDANTLYEPSTLLRLVRHFQDPKVGCVSGELSYRWAGETLAGQGERFYWHSEARIKELESRIGVAVGVTGGVYAVRRNLYRPMPDHYQSDLITPFWIAEQGYQTVYDPEARVTESPVDSAGSLFETKRRIVLRAISTLFGERRFLNPRRFGRAAWCLWSHKVLRWLAPVPLAGLLGTSFILVDQPLYGIFFGLQSIFYASAVIGLALEKYSVRMRGFFIPYYFCVVNAAAAAAVLGALRGREIRTWTPTRHPLAAI